MSEEECACSLGCDSPWHYQREGGQDVLMVPLRDAEHLYGMLRLALPPGRRLQAWQRTLLEAVSRHMGIALGLSLQADRERLLALQEERSIIARELHDSLAQSLSYMKIQVSLLTSALAGDGHADEAPAILADIKEGINLAYRQLRELLSTFRLRMEGDFARLLTSTVEEFSGRSDVPIDLDLRLGGCHLNPNQEIHLLHIVREALSNASRHAKAGQIRVGLSCRHAGEVNLIVEDDGKGIEMSAAGQPHHYGLTIMAERARGLGGLFEVLPRPGGGTVVKLSFNPLAGPSARPSTIAAEPR
jgi:two-component system nitrate/nitrite sensor histidine kinase NarX